MMEITKDVLEPDTVVEKKAWAILKNHVGRDNAISVPEFAKRMELKEYVARRLVKHLVEKHYWPIGSSTQPPPGYYIITEDKEILWTKASLIHRALSILERARVYDKAGWVHELMGQIRMKMEADSHDK
ncbi:MAG: hypothetical protein PWQ97_464 [Tepidanaerobacteraceae bacterium]|nr:hypothetical protein [Tepidanaerobacteraceae bacterium]